MKTKKPILRLVALAALSFFTGNELVAQTTVGAACGCPNYATRVSNGTFNITNVAQVPITAANAQSSVTPAWVEIPNAYGKELQNGTITLTCDKIWQIDEKLYIGNGSTLIIEPGTVIKGTVTGVGQTVANARALIIERGGKIIAAGTEECPIIFTANADVLNGTSVTANDKGLWGGVLICGRATNNLSLALNGPFVPGQSGKMAVANGLGVLEGFAASVPQDWFGAAQSSISGYTSATAPTGPTYTWSPSALIQNAVGTTTLKLTANNASIANGMTVTGTGIATSPATTVTAYNATTFVVTLSAATTANMSGTYTFTDGTNTTTSIAAANYGGLGSNQITLSAAPSWNIIGKTIAGTGIATSPVPTITAISGSLITLSSALTANASGALTITGTYPNAGGTASYANVGGSSTATGAATIQGPVMFSNGTITGPGQLVDFSQPAPQAESFNDDDNSGVMSHVSIRHAGANLLVGSEINGLTLASVGRGTKIDHIEIVSCADDNIEIFGGTVNFKYCTTLFGNDDMYDYDLGWTGKAQFLFGMKANHNGTPNISFDSDNGFEADGGDGKQFVGASNPTIYNATIVGNTKVTGNGDNGGLAGMNFKEGARGTLRNSVFAGFKNGFNLEDAAMGTGNLLHNAYHNWTNAPATGTYAANSLVVKCNTFIGTTYPISFQASNNASNTPLNSLANGMQAQFVADSNYVLTPATGATAIAGFDYAFEIGANNTIVTRNDVVPNNVYQVKLSASCPQAPMDGFFEPANYRGAFKPGVGNDNWLSDWTYSQLLKATKGLNPCVGDLNNDGNVNVTDFNLFAPAFGTACN